MLRSISLTDQIFDKYANYYFIESGTYMGGATAQAARSGNFTEIHSIEYLLENYIEAKTNLIEYKNITLYHNDSIDILPNILEDISKNKKATILLDGHVDLSKSTRNYGQYAVPVLTELEIIKDSGRTQDTILIDDIRCTRHSGQRDENKWWKGITLDSLINLLKDINNDYKIVYEDSKHANDDIMVAIP